MTYFVISDILCVAHKKQNKIRGNMPQTITAPWYNTKSGIQSKLNSLAGLNELAAERHTAGYLRREKLNDFFILGRWITDGCGNFAKIVDQFVPKERFSHIPDVLRREELFSFLESKGMKRDEMQITSVLSSDVPPVNISCNHCKRPWSIENCHDVVVVREKIEVLLTEFADRKLYEVEDTYSKKTDGVYRMQDEILIRNDRFIDLRVHPQYPSLKVNERGWVGKQEGIRKLTYTIREGDEGFFNVWRYYHRACNRQKLTVEMEQSFREIFNRAGFQTVILRPFPNQYCACEHCTPWFHVETECGKFSIGWRKRVINIDWSTIGDLSIMFPNEDVTKGSCYIHAWGNDKATEYLGRIRNHLTS